jgi:hypothetical protein
MENEKKEKDFWDKVSIVLHPLNGLLTALAVALLGYFTTTTLRQRETAETNQRVFTEIMTSREQAESGLRKDMFLSIMQTFQAPGGENSLEGKMLDLELLSYNFHESLNLKPLFTHISRQIQASNGVDKAALNTRLNRVAREITTRQLVLLEQVGQKFSRSVDFDKLKDNPGGIELDPETLTLNNIQRELALTVIQVDRERKELTMEMSVRTPEESANARRLQFHVGFFDFPMIDTTQLSHDQRVAVTLMQASNDSAELTLVLFPGSYASLKERISYDQVLEKLRNNAPQ